MVWPKPGLGDVILMVWGGGGGRSWITQHLKATHGDLSCFGCPASTLLSLVAERGKQKGQILSHLAKTWHLTWLGQLLPPALEFKFQVAKDGKKSQAPSGL